ncbi:hypothetical protein HAHE_16280 [Haloferula helveola]|uniref:Uncharacterized protein n=1 Tax=Haloferula helveola TaxID=490095 RepID=A0ABM7RCF0_9BACT|nr:hypothetical protein HAHE_16280 [Haloferula helveola]
MKRKRAIILSGLGVCVLAYAIWLGRPFYVRPGLLVDHQIPPEAEEVVREWFEESGGCPPAQLNFANLLEALSSPSGSSVGHAGAILESATEIRVVHDGREWHFVKGVDGWAFDRAGP